VSLLAEPGAALLVDFLDHSTRAVPLALDDAGLAVLVVDTRVSHALVDGGYASRRADCETACRELGVPSLRKASLDRVEALSDSRIRRRARHVVTEIDRVASTVEAVERGDWKTVGELFVASHASMRDDFEISCPELDTAVEAALAAGAVGARMTGGGFGGSAVALVPTDSLDRLTAAVDEAFDASSFRRPTFLLADPSPAAGLC
jgi:galactokinase